MTRKQLQQKIIMKAPLQVVVGTLSKQHNNDIHEVKSIPDLFSSVHPFRALIGFLLLLLVGEINFSLRLEFL